MSLFCLLIIRSTLFHYLGAWILFQGALESQFCFLLPVFSFLFVSIQLFLMALDPPFQKLTKVNVWLSHFPRKKCHLQQYTSRVFSPSHWYGILDKNSCTRHPLISTTSERCRIPWSCPWILGQPISRRVISFLRPCSLRREKDCKTKLDFLLKL